MAEGNEVSLHLFVREGWTLRTWGKGLLRKRKDLGVPKEQVNLHSLASQAIAKCGHPNHTQRRQLDYVKHSVGTSHNVPLKNKALTNQ